MITENSRNKIESTLLNLEAELKNGTLTEEEISKAKSTVKGLYKLANYSEEEIKSVEKRLSKLTKDDTIKLSSEPGVTAKSVSVNKSLLTKGLKKKAAIAAVVAGVALTGVIVTGAMKNETVENTPKVVAAATTVEKVDSSADAIEESNAMSEEIQAFADNTVLSGNDALSVGINLSQVDELTEADKETYATVLTNYRIVANLDDFSNLEYAELFAENANPTEDLVESFFEYNTMIKIHLITVTSSNTLDYNYLYSNEKDAQVLNESEALIAKLNEASGEEKLNIAKEYYTFVVNTLTSTEGNIALSSQALDTLITHSEAYDELTRDSYSNIQGAHVDDELEHYLNVAKDACLGVSNDENLEVEEVGIENLKSVFRISFVEKLNTAYESALEERTLQLSLGNTLNENNSYANVVAYVKENIDLTKYNAIDKDAYIEKQKDEKGLNEPAHTVKSNDDSGISDGNGGNISKSDMDAHDADTKDEYEQKVQDEEDQKTEENATITDKPQYEVDASEQPTTEQAQNTAKDYSEGYNDGLAGNSKKSGRSDAYYSGYAAGEKERLEAQQQFSNQTTEYVEDHVETTTESEIVEENYTTNILNSAPTSQNTVESNDSVTVEQPGTTYVPVSNQTEEVVESEIVEENYTYDKSADLEALKQLREEILSNVDDELDISKSL